jgi:hypothetical protein
MAIPAIGYVAVGSGFVPAIAGIIRYRRLGRVMKLFVVFCVILALSFVVEFLFGLFRLKNYFISDIYHLGEVPLMALIYYRSTARESTRNILRACTAVFLAVWLIDEIFFFSPERMNNALAMISRITLVFMSSVTFDTFVKTTATKLVDEPLFWILTGTILYSSGSLVVVGLGNKLLELGVAYITAAWYLNWTLSIVSMILFTKGLLCKAQV